MHLNKKSNQSNQNYCGATSKYTVNFKSWFEDQEWPGASFDGDSTRYVNPPEAPIRSKWGGPGAKPERLMQGDEDTAEKLYGFKSKHVFKKMKKLHK